MSCGGPHGSIYTYEAVAALIYSVHDPHCSNLLFKFLESESRAAPNSPSPALLPPKASVERRHRGTRPPVLRPPILFPFNPLGPSRQVRRRSWALPLVWAQSHCFTLADDHAPAAKKKTTSVDYNCSHRARITAPAVGTAASGAGKSRPRKSAPAVE